MDPVTLFALANGAVSAVKAGCKLYKDIKGAAGEVKEVLKDLDDQFHKLHPPEKPATNEQKRQFLEEKERVKELNKKANDGHHTGIYQEIGEHLGAYYDNYYKCVAIFDEEEKRSHSEIYTGDASLGKRALQRVLMRKQLEQMGKDLRELMIYQSPPELGALYTEVDEMMKIMGAEQQELIAKQMRQERLALSKRQKKIHSLWLQALWGIGAITITGTICLGLALIVEDRIKKYPHLGNAWIPKSEEERLRDLQPKVYTGR